MCLHVYVSHKDCEEMKWLFVSGSQDQNVHIWRYNRQEEEEEEDVTVSLLHCCKGHARSVEALAVNPDRTKVSVINNNSQWSAINEAYHFLLVCV